MQRTGLRYRCLVVARRCRRMWWLSFACLPTEHATRTGASEHTPPTIAGGSALACTHACLQLSHDCEMILHAWLSCMLMHMVMMQVVPCLQDQVLRGLRNLRQHQLRRALRTMRMHKHHADSSGPSVCIFCVVFKHVVFRCS